MVEITGWAPLRYMRWNSIPFKLVYEVVEAIFENQ